MRWLRPDYQIPRFGTAKEKAQLEAELMGGEGEGMAEDKAAEKKPAFPKRDVEQTLAVTLALANAAGPVSADAIARTFQQGRKIEKQVAFTLRALIRMGEITSSDGGQTFSVRRAA